MTDGMSIMKSFSAEDAIAMQKFNTEALTRPALTNRYRLDPRQSYVSREVREKDAAFWMPKSQGTPAKVPAKKPAQP